VNKITKTTVEAIENYLDTNHKLVEGITVEEAAKDIIEDYPHESGHKTGPVPYDYVVEWLIMETGQNDYDVVDVRTLTVDEIASTIRELEIAGTSFGWAFVRYADGTIALVPDRDIELG
jgi:hypothetical protein